MVRKYCEWCGSENEEERTDCKRCAAPFRITTPKKIIYEESDGDIVYIDVYKYKNSITSIKYLLVYKDRKLQIPFDLKSFDFSGKIDIGYYIQNIILETLYKHSVMHFGINPSANIQFRQKEFENGSYS